ncbi:T9SS type A sorting domain-containing protein [Algoriphagus algorifonticola]|uniref:T9SS type A sorting domain-containing protein n=1 Tax=Algoriphagus algorifonticola TaxID=2593007 RepID=UPI0011A8A2EE|nr:T9SS type A sorting domain-containing protein [Algoriphagus algorifonticola]
MKKIYVFLLLLIANGIYAQIPEPVILYMEPKHGEGTEQIHNRAYPTFDGNFFIGIGTASQTGDFQNFCLGQKNKVVYTKYKADGYSIEWTDCYSDGFGIIDRLPNGEKILFGNMGNDFQLRKDDANGSTIWTKQYGGSAGELFKDIISTDDGGYIAVFQTNSNDGDVGSHYGNQFTMDIWVMKVDSNGDKVWSTVLGGSQDERPTCIVPVPGGGCYVLAYTLSNDNDCITNHGNADVFVARLDKNGNKSWAKCFGGTGDDGARSTGIPSAWGVPDGKGGVLIATTTYSADGDITDHLGKADFWLLNIDSSNNILMNVCYGGLNSDEHAQTICKASDGSLWMGGTSIGNSGGQVDKNYGGYDGWLVHTDGIGNFLSAKVFGGPNTDEITMLQPLNNGLVLVGGTYWAAGGTVPDTFAGGATDVFLARIAPWTTHIHEEGQIVNGKLFVYPNPTNTIVHIQLNGTTKVRNVSIYDISGKRIYRSNSMPDSIDVKDWSSGIYTVEAKTTEEIFSTKIIIN